MRLSFYSSRSKLTTIFLCSFSCPKDGKHVVFGKVVEGMNVVKAIESVGSQSGATKSKVMIDKSGQL